MCMYFYTYIHAHMCMYIYIYIYIYIFTYIYMCINTYTYIYIYMMQGCHTPPSPPTPWYPPLPVKWVVVLFGCCFPRLVLFGLVPSPPPCGVGPAVFLVGPAPLVAGQCVLQTYGMAATAC